MNEIITVSCLCYYMQWKSKRTRDVFVVFGPTLSVVISDMFSNISLELHFISYPFLIGLGITTAYFIERSETRKEKTV